MEQRDSPRVTVRDVVPHAKAAGTCKSCYAFQSTRPKDKIGVCAWVPPPVIQEGSNQRKPEVAEDYSCSVYEVKA